VSLSPKPVVAKRAYVVCAYVPDSNEVPRPNKPKNCPAAASVEDSCNIHLERWRWRKCGLSFAVAGMYCHVHKVSFTVYPPGWLPYARKALMHIDHNGSAIELIKSDCGWSETLFAAGADAAREKLWPEEVHLGPAGNTETNILIMSRRTQRRHINGMMQLFGLGDNAMASYRDNVSRLLSVALIDLEEGSKRVRDGPTLVRKGLEVVRVLEKVQAIRLRMSGLLTLGTNQGFWGPALIQ
jgi:hypothetical protein